MSTDSPCENDRYKVCLKTKFLCPGMILKWDVYDPDGNQVIPAGYKMTQADIDKLIDSGVRDIFYYKIMATNRKDEGDPAIPLKLFAKAVGVMEEIKQAANDQIKLPEKEIDEVVDNFIESIVFASGDAVINLMDLKEHDDRIYNHSINTAVISIAFAKELGYNGKGIKIVGVGALLHNVGSLFVPREILDKDNNYTPEEQELIRRIPVFGYELIKNQTGFGPLVQRIVLFNNERYDGNGYPVGIAGSQIGDLPQVVSISSAYDTILTGRPGGDEKKPVWFALNLIERLGGSKFDPRLVKSFVELIPPLTTFKPLFAPGVFVELNTGEFAEVISSSREAPHRPMISILKTKDGPVQFPIPVPLQVDDARYIRAIVTDMKLVDELVLLKKKYNLPVSGVNGAEVKEAAAPDRKLHVESKIRAKANFFKIDPDLLETDETNLR